MKKQALIVANLAGFASFLIPSMQILQKFGYEITYAANANKLEWSVTKSKLDEMGVRFVQIDFDSQKPLSSENRKAYRQLKALLKEKQYDLVHCHTPIAGLLTRLAAKRQRKKGTCVIYTTHGFAFTSRSGKKQKLLYGTLEKFGSRFCDAIVTINREDYVAAKKMHCKKVYYVNGVGVDTQRFRDAEVDRDTFRAQIGIAPDRIMVLSVGELSVRKNHRIIIEAIALLPDKDRYVYVICGNGINGGTGNALQTLASERGVDLRLLGFRRDIPQIMKVSDIGAIPSIREGLGLAGVQSLAAGIPIVGSDVQGIKDYIVDGKTGYLCNPFDAAAFARAITKLVAEREGMANDCREVAKAFDIAVAKAQIEAIYTELLG